MLITGGSGFIGLNLAEALLGRGQPVVLFGPDPPPDAASALLAAGGPAFAYVAGDVRDGSALRDALRGSGAEAMVHGAAITSGADRERGDFATVVDVNIQGTVAALEAARQAGARRFLYLSSVAVYGLNGFAAGMLDEQATPALPRGLYAITKHAGEQLSLRYGETHGLSVLAARVGAAFGRWERATGVRDTMSAVHRTTALALAGREAVLPSVGRKDWIYAPDIAAALLLLMDLPAPPTTLYNIGPGREWTLEAWCRRLAERFPGFRYRLAAHPRDANIDLYGNDGRSPMAIDRLRADTGFAPRFGLDEAFADYMAWLEGRGL